MVPSSTGSSHFVGLLNPKYEGFFEISETICPITQCSIPEAVIFQHNVMTFPMTIAINRLTAELNAICPFLALFGAHHILHVSRRRVKPSLRYELFPIVHSNSVPIATVVFVYYNLNLPICKSWKCINLNAQTAYRVDLRGTKSGKHMEDVFTDRFSNGSVSA